MKSINRVLAVWKYQTITNIFDIKTFVVLLVLMFYMRSILEPVNNFLISVNVKSHPYVFPILMSDYIVPVVVMIGYLILICDAPFIKRGYLFIVARSGKVCWALGEILFLLTYAMSYAFMILIYTIINLLPNVEWGTDWGKAILTIMRTDAAEQFYISGWNPVVVDNYHALEALIKSYVLFAAGLWLIGLIVFGMNYLFKNNIGIMLSGIIIFFDIAINNIFYEKYYRFSPASLMKLSVTTGVGRFYPTFTEALVTLMISCIVLMMVILFRVKMRKGIKTHDRRNR